MYTLIGELSTCVISLSLFPIIYLVAKDTMLYSFRGKEGTKEAFTASGVWCREE